MSKDLDDQVWYISDHGITKGTYADSLDQSIKHIFEVLVKHKWDNIDPMPIKCGNKFIEHKEDILTLVKKVHIGKSGHLENGFFYGLDEVKYKRVLSTGHYLLYIYQMYILNCIRKEHPGLNIQELLEEIWWI